MKYLILASVIILIASCSKSSKYKALEEENRALKMDTMLQNKTIKRIFREKDSLERELLLDSLLVKPEEGSYIFSFTPFPVIGVYLLS